jgi:hypothetical protein
MISEIGEGRNPVWRNPGQKEVKAKVYGVFGIVSSEW